ncbi:maleylacetoacetate isomerase-like isoform X2 [Mya arenaria]|uniref:maleylacetoacetate isomerase-like isoform X2 n=1 Tax=Mya arenaria TaxID=6604 RepID=UPI0022E3736E|nr:maleylacetoacetate isomerase-like isoform X2 [Mya arenaria]XP_052786865.1 maleylacetoacetate isomerase-like isoform X2 [Mya arenaria]
MAAKPILYSYFRSSASWRVRIVLALKGIDYEYRAVNLVKDGGHQKKDEFTALNPMGQVPVLVVGDVAISQSLAIIDYLEDVYPNNPITPRDPIKKAQARSLTELISSGTQPMLSSTVRAQVDARELGIDAWMAYWIDRGFTAYEKMVQATAGKYSVGDEVTIADVCLVPQLYNAKRFKVDMSKFPTVTRIINALSELDAFKAASPEVQPDCPEELRAK